MLHVQNDPWNYLHMGGIGKPGIGRDLLGSLWFVCVMSFTVKGHEENIKALSLLKGNLSFTLAERNYSRKSFVS